MKQKHDLNELLRQAESLTSELSFDAVQQYIDTFPPTPPAPKWHEFLTLKTKWIMLSSFFTALITALFFTGAFTGSSDAETVQLATAQPSATTEDRADLNRKVAPNQQDRKKGLLSPTYTATLKSEKLVNSKEERLHPVMKKNDVIDASKDVSVKPHYSSTGINLPPSHEHPVVGVANEIDPLVFTVNQGDPDTLRLPKPPVAPTPPVLVVDLEATLAPKRDTTLLGRFNELEIKGKAMVYLTPGENNWIVIERPAGRRQSTSVSEMNDNKRRRVKVSLKAKDLFPEPFKVYVTATDLRRLKVDPEVELFVAEEFKNIEVSGGEIMPLSSAITPAEATDYRGHQRPYRWGKASDRKITKRIQLPAFTKLITKGDVRIVLRRADENVAEMLVPEALLEYVDFKVAKGVLTAKLLPGAPKDMNYDVQLSAVDLEEIVTRSKSCVYSYGELKPIKIKGQLCRTHNFTEGWVEE